jgi:hypothetical protein
LRNPKGEDLTARAAASLEMRGPDRKAEAFIDV